MSARASHLKVVELNDSGEVVGTDVADRQCSGCGASMGLCDSCRKKNTELARKNDEIAGLERDIRGWAVRYAELKRDKDAEAREHPMWPVGKSLFTEWKRATNHPRTQWTPERFWQVERFLTGGRFGGTVEERSVWIRRAIAGAAFDAFKTNRRNGTVKAHNDWELIFRTEDRFREFVARAPKGWTP